MSPCPPHGWRPWLESMEIVALMNETWFNDFSSIHAVMLNQFASVDQLLGHGGAVLFQMRHPFLYSPLLLLHGGQPSHQPRILHHQIGSTLFVIRTAPRPVRSRWILQFIDISNKTEKKYQSDKVELEPIFEIFTPRNETRMFFIQAWIIYEQ